MRDPAPGATAPPRKGSSTTTTFAVVPDALSIVSSEWTPGGEIPVSHTCDGVDVSPPLTINGAPASTVELLLVVTDQDAAGYLHWVVAGIDPTTSNFDEGLSPAGALEIVNDSGSPDWSGPCPPSGTHTYDFTVYALDQPSGLSPTSSREDIVAVESTAVTTAAMTGIYTRA